ncbi:MAG: hypothetical protein ACR2O6_10120, partial [Ilumatobacteraceae bacterium]
WAHYEPSDDTIKLMTTDTGDEWNLRFGRMTGTSPDTGNTYDLVAFDQLDGLTDPTTTISATALHLDLWMWGRSGDLPGLAGRTDLVDRFRTAIVECTA